MVKKVSKVLGEFQTIIVLVATQFVLGGVNIFSKLAVVDGMSMRVLIAYRYTFATATILPFAFILERKDRPKMTWTIAFLGFLSGLFGGSLSQNLILASLSLTSATFVTALAIVVPSFTFVVALLFKMETLAIRRVAGIAKVVGVVLSVAGALILTFYKGMEVDIWPTKIHLIKHQTNTTSDNQQHNHLIGALLAIAGCFTFGTWFIIQSKLGERYPCKYSNSALMCSTSAIQSIIYALCMEKDWSAWKLGWNIRLLASVYSGAVGGSMVIAIMSYYVHVKGPLYVSMFNPLTLVFVALLGSLMLDEKLYLGSIIAFVVIICGLYSMLWGKLKEKKKGSVLPEVITSQ